MSIENVVNKRVFVIGGGASGIIAAIIAKRKGAEVTILERNPRIGKKILATGNGRCNYTNTNMDVAYYHGGNPQFAYSALAGFNTQDTIDFFEKLGIAHKVEEQGKVFPMSDQASSFLNVFLYELEKIGVNVICNAYIKDITKKGELFNMDLENGSSYQGDRVIIATGGKAMPSTGSDGNGYRLAEKLGHTVTETFPALVQLKLEGEYFKQIQGVKFVGTAEILDGNKSVAKDRGDILFANYGISGPPILQISRKAGELLQEGKRAILKISIIDHIPKENLRKLLATRFDNDPHKTVEFSLVGLINKRLISVVLKEAGIRDIKRPVENISDAERERILNILIDWRFEVQGTKSWTSAQVTAGGVATDEINPQTMESKIVKGLFFAGEVLDIDGQCGGYNLQWAWSSGYIAGQNVTH